MESILKFDNVSKHYPNGVHALKDVSFEVREGEFVSVIGPSGSGKSTLLRAINRLIPISGGTVWLDGQAVSALRGKSLRQLRRKVGMIFQNYNLVYSLSVLQNVLHGRLGYMSGVKGVFGLYSEENRMNAHTRAGMFRRNVAKPRTTLAKRGKGETFSLPNRATKKARIAATVVADMARARVTSTLEKMPGIRLALGKAGGRKSSVMNSQKASPLAASTMGLNSVR